MKVEGEKVTLLREDGKQFTVPIQGLCAEDQEFLRSQGVPGKP